LDLLKGLDRTIAESGLLSGGEKVLVALSGGADSVGLLLALKARATHWGIALLAWHLNHRLRGEEAEADERFVRELCRSQEIPLTVKRADIRSHARTHRLSLEEAGRNLRYLLLEQTADDLGCQKIATGHNADDNAETIVMNLARGAGLAGLTGIPIRRGRVIRPFLEIERPAIERYLARLGISYRRDSSNKHLEFRRNLIRHKLMPLLKEVNPKVTAALGRLARILRDEDALLDSQAAKFLRRVAKPVSGAYLLDSALFLRYNISLRRRILKLLMPQLTLTTLEAVLKTASGPTGKSNTVKGQVIVRNEGRQLFVGEVKKLHVIREQRLEVPGKTKLERSDLVIETKLVSGRQFRRERRAGILGPETEAFDFSRVSLPLFVRSRRNGDRMKPFGGEGKKLKEILIDDKVPWHVRDGLPVVCDQQGILMVAGSRRADRARVDPDTREVMTLTTREAQASSPSFKLKPGEKPWPKA
jgi:tRNA(Ile)-lysidine synthase